ncbi:hypothetical protein HanRHA438_Chr08g0363401 [Helianthus annuus]|nr:hypothetical protein HanRHA438_Chr08g0363401 [Helianthus annuus]
MWNLVYFQSITYFFYFFFSMCAFLKKAHAFFLRLEPRLRARPMRLACAFDNIGCCKYLRHTPKLLQWQMMMS